ncbi:glycosyltransferase [uncultured Succinatimonas sp.]|uniref:glycosyltransferase n=1 Tax=uncultured Succinatimonas sp. TaxID=1262973 RepID=UPI0025F40097|nr:glycosyltransferase [uncultured Succinatimonas sp.]
MKCYICLTAPHDDNDVYVSTLEATLVSARKNTSLEIVALYDGSEDSECYKLLKLFEVEIIKHEFSHKSYLDKIYPNEHIKRNVKKEDFYHKLSGTFMRLDIPFVEKEEKYVLYVDIDVIFLKDIVLADLPKPKFLAAAPEFDKNVSKMKYFNAGVLLLNIEGMKEKCRQIFSKMEKCTPTNKGLFDQGYLNEFCFKDMELLPLIYNWKPYWGINDEAVIIHFHGMKPLGNNESSGFGMNDSSLISTLSGHTQDINGYVFYLSKYFDLLSKDGDLWLSNFISHIFYLFNDRKENSEFEKQKQKYKKKIKKIKKMSFLFNILIIGCFLSLYLFNLIGT